ncbi:MAG: hypothetical protein ACREEM_47880 [Blastocatellia bacterium]
MTAAQSPQNDICLRPCNNHRVMSTITAPTISAPAITALQAQAEANLFLSDHLPDRFMAGQPVFDAVACVWRAPVLLAYPIIGSVGQTGEILIGADEEKVVSYTPLDEMKAAASKLYEQHRDAIEAPVP